MIRTGENTNKLSSSNKLENIEEENTNPDEDWLPSSVRPPETPMESMEFLARSWSLSATELSMALLNTDPTRAILDQSLVTSHLSCGVADEDGGHPRHPMEDSRTNLPLVKNMSPPVSPTESEEAKELLLLQHAIKPDFSQNHQIFKNRLQKTALKGKTKSRWSSKEQKERKKHEIRTHNAQLHAAISVAGVAAAIAAITASNATSETPTSSILDPLVVAARMSQATSLKMVTAIASAAALVASHCIDTAQDMGADHHQILTAINSAVNARSNGDIMALTAGAATALRGAAILKARIRHYHGDGDGGGGDKTFADDHQYGKEITRTKAMNFISTGGELLKRTRQGVLHWKQVSFKLHSNFQVMIKLKSKHMGGTFTKKKKFLVSGVHSDIPQWPGREREGYVTEWAYFGVQIADRVIEFECKNKAEMQIWVEGIEHMLNYRIRNVVA